MRNSIKNSSIMTLENNSSEISIHSSKGKGKKMKATKPAKADEHDMTKLEKKYMLLKKKNEALQQQLVDLLGVVDIHTHQIAALQAMVQQLSPQQNVFSFPLVHDTIHSSAPLVVTESMRDIARKFESGILLEQDMASHTREFSGKEFDRTVFDNFDSDVTSDQDNHLEIIPVRLQSVKNEDRIETETRALTSTDSIRNLASRFESGAILERESSSRNESYCGKEFDRSVFQYEDASDDVVEKPLSRVSTAVSRVLAAETAQTKNGTEKPVALVSSLASRFESGQIQRQEFETRSKSFAGKEFDQSVFKYVGQEVY